MMLIIASCNCKVPRVNNGLKAKNNYIRNIHNVKNGMIVTTICSILKYLFLILSVCIYTWLSATNMQLMS